MLVFFPPSERQYSFQQHVPYEQFSASPLHTHTSPPPPQDPAIEALPVLITAPQATRLATQLSCNSNSNGKKRRDELRTPPVHMLISLVMVMVCCVVGTPLSLLLTVPAYVLTDKVSPSDQPPNCLL